MRFSVIFDLEKYVWQFLADFNKFVISSEFFFKSQAISIVIFNNRLMIIFFNGLLKSQFPGYGSLFAWIKGILFLQLGLFRVGPHFFLSLQCKKKIFDFRKSLLTKRNLVNN